MFHEFLPDYFSKFHYKGTSLTLRGFIHAYYPQLAYCKITEIEFTENNTYLISSTNARYILRIYRKNKRTHDEITREVAYTMNLNSHNIKVPKFIQSPNTKQYINQITYDHDTWNITVMEYIPGRHPPKYSYGLCTQIIEQLAKSHQLLGRSKMTKKTNYSISASNLFTTAELQELEQFESPFVRRALSFTVLCRDFWGAYIHADLHKENILVDRYNNLLAIIDFDDLAFLPLVYDLGSLLWSIWYNTHNKKLLKYSIQNYALIHRLSERERATLADFMYMRNYYFALLEIISNPNTDTLSIFIKIESEINNLHI